MKDRPMTFKDGLILAIVTSITIGILNFLTYTNKVLFLSWFDRFAQWTAPAFKWLFASLH